MDLIRDKLGKCSEEELQDEVVYLDYAGAAIPPKSVVRSALEELLSTNLGNPHTRGSKFGERTHSFIEEARGRLLEFVDASSDEYMVVFTSGCTASLKLVADAFPWSDESHFAYSMNSHNSLMAIRSAAKNWKALPSAALFQDQCNEDVLKYLAPSIPPGHPSYSLLALPGECNFTGSRLNLNIVDQYLRRLEQNSSSHQQWLWLLDAAKLVASSPLSLSALPASVRPHFVTLSFYKIFGYPTGLGALIIRRDLLPLLRKKFYGGGTILAGAADSSFLVPKASSTSDHFEDGTCHYQGITALRHGFRFIEQLGGMHAVSMHTAYLRNYLFLKMQNLRHSTTDRDLCTFYSYSHTQGNGELNVRSQGPVIAFNLCYADGTPLPFGIVGAKAEAAGIQLRTGCFCNLGGCQEILHLSADDVETNFHRGRYCSEDRDRAADIVQDKHTGACRLSLGYGSTQSDCDALLNFLRTQFLNELPPDVSSDEENSNDARMHYAASSTKRMTTILGPASGKESNLVSDEDLYATHHVQSFLPTEIVASERIGLPPRIPTPLADSITTESINAACVRLEAIFVYPVKSCAGVRVDHWPLVPPQGQGLFYDRIFAITDDSGRVLSQKTHPMLALIRPYFFFRDDRNSAATIDADYGSDRRQGVDLHLRSPFNSSDLVLSLDEGDIAGESSRGGDAVAEQVLRICGRKVCSRPLSRNADNWISEFFRNSEANRSKEHSTTKTIRQEEKSYHILRCAALLENTIGSKTKSADNAATETAVTSASFANTAQFLLLSTESVRSLVQVIRTILILLERC